MFFQYILCNIRRQRSSCVLGVHSSALFRHPLPQVIFDLRVFHAAPTFVDLVGSKRLGESRGMCAYPTSYTGKPAIIAEAIRINNWNPTSARPLNLLV